MADANDYDSFEDDGPEDQYEAALDRCGSRGKRQCDLAGTEFCDWCCPLHDEVFPPRRSGRSALSQSQEGGDNVG